ncbi:MAG: sugar phosphate isomerase/epimerase family protein [Planctomycetota bacterium]
MKDKTIPFRFALNTSTIRQQRLSVPEQIRVTAEAGFDGIEPWIRDLRRFIEQGGSVADLRKQIEDSGLRLVSAIGFAQWIVDDETQRRKGLEEAKRDMELVRDLGGRHIAAPPIGAHKPNMPKPDLPTIAQRYRDLCQLGQSMDVHPQLELWGFSPTLSRLGELAFVATEAAHPMARLLPDFYHIRRGGNDFEGLAMLEASMMDCFHINDYPGDIATNELSDADRVFPGDGDAPLSNLIAGLGDRGFRGYFSLELFNPDYWKRDALEVAREGLKKCRLVAQASPA